MPITARSPSTGVPIPLLLSTMTLLLIWLVSSFAAVDCYKFRCVDQVLTMPNNFHQVYLNQSFGDAASVYVSNCTLQDSTFVFVGGERYKPANIPPSIIFNASVLRNVTIVMKSLRVSRVSFIDTSLERSSVTLQSCSIDGRTGENGADKFHDYHLFSFENIHHPANQSTKMNNSVISFSNVAFVEYPQSNSVKSIYWRPYNGANIESTELQHLRWNNSFLLENIMGCLYAGCSLFPADGDNVSFGTQLKAAAPIKHLYIVLTEHATIHRDNQADINYMTIQATYGKWAQLESFVRSNVLSSDSSLVSAYGGPTNRVFVNFIILRKFRWVDTVVEMSHSEFNTISFLDAKIVNSILRIENMQATKIGTYKPFSMENSTMELRNVRLRSIAQQSIFLSEFLATKNSTFHIVDSTIRTVLQGQHTLRMTGAYHIRDGSNVILENSRFLGGLVELRIPSATSLDIVDCNFFDPDTEKIYGGYAKTSGIKLHIEAETQVRVVSKKKLSLLPDGPPFPPVRFMHLVHLDKNSWRYFVEWSTHLQELLTNVPIATLVLEQFRLSSGSVLVDPVNQNLQDLSLINCYTDHNITLAVSHARLEKLSLIFTMRPPGRNLSVVFSHSKVASLVVKEVIQPVANLRVLFHLCFHQTVIGNFSAVDYPYIRWRNKIRQLEEQIRNETANGTSPDLSLVSAMRVEEDAPPEEREFPGGELVFSRASGSLVLTGNQSLINTTGAGTAETELMIFSPHGVLVVAVDAGASMPYIIFNQVRADPNVGVKFYNRNSPPNKIVTINGASGPISRGSGQEKDIFLAEESACAKVPVWLQSQSNVSFVPWNISGPVSPLTEAPATTSVDPLTTTVAPAVTPEIPNTTDAATTLADEPTTAAATEFSTTAAPWASTTEDATTTKAFHTQQPATSNATASPVQPTATTPSPSPLPAPTRAVLGENKTATHTIPFVEEKEPPPTTPPPPAPPTTVSNANSRTLALVVVMKKEEAEAVAGASTSVAGASAVMSPTAASNAVRSASVIKSIECHFENSTDAMEPNFMEHPMRFLRIGEGPLSSYAGASLLTTALLVFAPCCCNILVFSFWKREAGGEAEGSTENNKSSKITKKKQKKTGKREKGTDQEEDAHTSLPTPLKVQKYGFSIFSSISLVYFLPSVAFASTLILAHPADATRGQQVVAVLNALLCLGPVVFYATTLCRSKSFIDSISIQGKEVSRSELLHKETRVVYGNSHTTTRYFCESLAPFFDATSNAQTLHRRIYFLEEVLVSVLMMIIAGIQPYEGSCTKITGALIAVTVLHVLYLLWARPYNSKIESFFSYTQAFLQCALAISAAISISNPAALTAVAYGIIVQGGLFFAQVVVQAFWAWTREQRRQVLQTGSSDGEQPLLQIKTMDGGEDDNGEENGEEEMTAQQQQQLNPLLPSADGDGESGGSSDTTTTSNSSITSSSSSTSSTSSSSL